MIITGVFANLATGLPALASTMSWTPCCPIWKGLCATSAATDPCLELFDLLGTRIEADELHLRSLLVPQRGRGALSRGTVHREDPIDLPIRGERGRHHGRGGRGIFLGVLNTREFETREFHERVLEFVDAFVVGADSRC